MRENISARINECYSIFSRELKDANSTYAEEFEKLIASSHPKEVFLWLDEKKRAKLLPQSIEPILTDFFWYIY